MAAFKDKNLEIIAGAYRFFISKGIPDSEPILIEALERYDDMSMAEDFFNCGNSKLKDAACEWAKQQGKTISNNPDSEIGPSWGKDR